jgi:hypothetical protein
VIDVFKLKHGVEPGKRVALILRPGGKNGEPSLRVNAARRSNERFALFRHRAGACEFMRCPTMRAGASSLQRLICSRRGR